MSWELIFFAVFSAAMLICAIGVVAFESPVHSAAALVGSFINVAALFVLLGAEFLAVLQIIVYTGAVLVLHDMLGMNLGKMPRFVRNFMADAGSVQGAMQAYVKAVKEGSFPDDTAHAW